MSEAVDLGQVVVAHMRTFGVVVIGDSGTMDALNVLVRYAQSVESELQRYREREPLVQKLLEACGAFDARQPGTVYQDLAREDALLVRDFKLEGT